MAIRKIIIPVAGFGTRMLPATKSIPKEMVPIVDRPVVHYLVEEAVQSGITDVVFVNHPSKKSLEDYFKPNPDLEKRLKDAGKHDLLKQLEEINDMARISTVYQPEPLGNGHAILMAKELIGDEPFAIVWGDDIFEGEEPRVKQLIETYEEHKGSVLALVRGKDEASFPEYCKRYGCVGADEVTKTVHKIHTIIEKPAPEEAPSDLFSVGGYVFTPTIFKLLEATKPGKSGEIWLADAATELLKQEAIYGRVIDGTYWDIGNKMGFLKANLHYGLLREDTGGELEHFIEGLGFQRTS
jgi:UTP--glucose-1-phosphate uridylyltransferase